jgi:hypothetical protein
MATSIQISTGRAEAFNDLDLLVLLHLMIQHASSGPSETPATSEIVSRLKAICEGYGPGSIDLHLNELSSNEVFRKAYLDTLRTTMEHLGCVGAVYPAKTIMKDWLTGGVKVNDYSVDLIRATGQRVSRLLEP